MDNEFEENMRGLENAWNAFVYDMYNGPNSHMHPPPPLVEAVKYCWGTLAKNALGDSLDIEEIPVGAPVVIPAGFLTLFGAVMFEYGQRCISWGLLVQNMEQCHCNDVSDDDLTEALSEWEKKDKQ